MTQCRNLNIPFLDGSIAQHLDHHSLVLDGIFGFSFQGSVRAPFKDMIHDLKLCSLPIVSIDIPSGWDVELGNKSGAGLEPQVLISLTYPKICALKFKGKHYVGGRFLSRNLREKFGIKELFFPNADQFVDISELRE